ncbi:hypothetical protein N7524_003886 [Penicillium chrysogenum]|nr:hypothetical protein N7524_003886 [Penicillium chrysogenum]
MAFHFSIFSTLAMRLVLALAAPTAFDFDNIRSRIVLSGGMGRHNSTCLLLLLLFDTISHVVS